MDLRQRSVADLAACVDLLMRSHERDGYPVVLPAGIDAFLAPPELIAAWVATEGTAVVGHAALHSRTTRPVMDLAARSGLDRMRLGVVARLMVDRRHRRRGVGGRLLAEVEAEARRRGLVPLLDVMAHFTPAIRLYEQHGWRRLGEVSFVLPDGAAHTEIVFVASDSDQGPAVTGSGT